jgi:hypothetical protein
LSASKDALDIKPVALLRQTKVAVADIILVGAEIDHLISLALFTMAGIEPHNGFFIIKRMQIGEKLDRLKYFVESRGHPDAMQDFDTLITHLETFTRIRNVLAHGIYMGMRQSTGEFYFQSTGSLL